ncbi:hypothetical protein OQA88_9284 [Cercophora sp. LCS_1]
MLSSLFGVVLGLAALATAAPAANSTVAVRAAFNCNNPVGGLNKADCEYLSRIGFAGTGSNPTSNANSRIWIGGNGPNVFTFTNRATNPNADIILVLWDDSQGFASSFVTAHAPKLTLSIPYGGTVTVSMANGVTGAYSALYRHVTTISPNGQVFNTWGEFTTGQWATINISRLVNMGGNSFSARVSTGCVADHTRCSYVCKSGNTCWVSGSYDLIGCRDQPNNNAWYGGADPEGGCAGWDNGSGRIAAEFF